MSVGNFSSSGATFEFLEQRQMFAVSPVYEPNALVAGQRLPQYAADFWKGIFAIPVYAADGKTIINPQFDGPLNDGDILKTTHTFTSPNGKVVMLAGSFFGGKISRTVTVPSDTPIFVPMLNDEWSNPDTADPPKFDSVPGHYTPSQLAAFAVKQTDTFRGLSARLDGVKIADVAKHREKSLAFKYTQPAKFSITQVFFNESAPGPNAAAADGFYLMLKPLSVGKHVLHFVGSGPDNSASPPLLGAFQADMTYTINVVAKGSRSVSAFVQGNAASSAPAAIDRSDLRDLLGSASDDIL